MQEKLVESRVDLSKPPALSAERRAELIALAEAHAQNIDFSDAPYLGDEAWAHGESGRFYRGGSEPVQPVLVANDVLVWFRKQGEDYQTRINDVLRQEMQRGLRASSEQTSEPLKKSA